MDANPITTTTALNLYLTFLTKQPTFFANGIIAIQIAYPMSVYNNSQFICIINYLSNVVVRSFVRLKSSKSSFVGFLIENACIATCTRKREMGLWNEKRVYIVCSIGALDSIASR